jgi:hypothetical protein
VVDLEGGQGCRPEARYISAGREILRLSCARVSDAAREIPRPAGESAGLRDDAVGNGSEGVWRDQPGEWQL